MISSILPDHVYILSATGDINTEEVECAKRDWVHDVLGIPDNRVLLVEHTEDKKLAVVDRYERHFLIDDRMKAIDSWTDHDNGFFSMLFVDKNI